MRRCYFIAATEAVTVGVAHVPFYVRITKLLAVFYVRAAVIVEVAAGAFHAVVKPAPLDFVELAGRSVPPPLLPVGNRLQWRGGRNRASWVHSRNNQGKSRYQ
jgi:hypothetical protein